MYEFDYFLKKLCLYFGSLFIISTPIVWFSLTETNFDGDLTRISKLSENDFGWKMEQATIPFNLRSQATITEADTLIIGDSFSAALIWQTKLKENKLNPITYHWDQVGLICKNFDKNLKASGFKGKKIILEIVELGAVDKINKSLNCESQTNNFTKPMGTNQAIPTKLDFSRRINMSGQFITGLETAINSWLLNQNNNYWLKLNKRSKSGHIQPLEDGCKLFTNHLCNFGLFYHQDYKKPALSLELLEKIKLINSQIKNYQVTWLIIPNKSTIYHRYTRDEFWQRLDKERLGPNLYGHFLTKKYLIKDLYKPNDTHLSNYGYLDLGNITYNFLNREAYDIKN